jgi:hypothetical protein
MLVIAFFRITALIPENARQTGWQTGSWRPSIQSLAASAYQPS